MPNQLAHTAVQPRVLVTSSRRLVSQCAAQKTAISVLPIIGKVFEKEVFSTALSLSESKFYSL